MRRFGSVYILFVTVLVLLLFFQTSAAQDLTLVTPREAGLSARKLAKIDELIQKNISQEKLKGATVLVARHGKLAYLKAFGEMDEGRTMQPDTIFRICSMTKPVTAVGVMMLWDKGLIRLEDPVSKFIPEFADTPVLVEVDDENAPEGFRFDLGKLKRPITIFDLLTHTSGISYGFWGRPEIAAAYIAAGVSDGLSVTEGTIAEGMQKLAALPLFFNPGEGWEYGLSNDVLGRVIEVVSGLPLDAYFQENIFKPLGMEDTFFFLPDEKISRLADVYEPSEEGVKKLSEKRVLPGILAKTPGLIYDPFYSCQGPKTYFSGGGGLHSTATDYFKFCQMMLNKGELHQKRLLKPATVEMMTQNQIGRLSIWWSGPTAKYGFGFSVSENKNDGTTSSSIGTYGWGGFYFTRFYIDPAHEVVAVMMAQLRPNGHMEEMVSKLWGLTQAAVRN